MKSKSFKDLTVYKKAFLLAMEVFSLSKEFPKEERYSLTDQIRRSSRSVAVCIAEAYRKRNYQAYFVSKSSDAAKAKSSQTLVSLFSMSACHYIDEQNKNRLEELTLEIGKLLNHMIEFPEKYTRKSTHR